LRFEGDLVAEFEEKPQVGEGWINGGFFVLEPAAVDYITEDCMFEHGPLEKIAAAGQLAAYRHEGFWQCMDTLRDVRLLDGLWQEQRAPWKVW
jgi:glucose-1-phosphate cytidylyltransferase